MYPRFLEIEITGKCRYKCRHCYGDFPRPGELSIETLKDVLTQSEEFFDAIILSGGEPLLHPQLAEMVELASESFVVFITTSGSPMTPALAGRIRGRAILVYGLDGIGDTHDTYRGVPGAFGSLVQALEMTREFPKEIIVTLWRGAIPEIDDIIRLSDEYNALVHFNAIIPVGRAGQNPDILPDVKELEALAEKLYRLKTSGGGVVTDLHRVTERDRHEGIDLFCRGRFNITPEGNVRPCEFHYAVLGNIYEEPLEQIIRRAGKTPLIRRRENGFRDCVRLDLPNPFDYHTTICHKLGI